MRAIDDKEENGDSPFAVNGQAALALEAHLLVAATDVFAFALVAALVLLLAALVRDCDKKKARSRGFSPFVDLRTQNQNDPGTHQRCAPCSKR